MKVFASSKSKSTVNKIVIAYGGGSVIDKAKVYCKKHNKKLIAIPTTASGASMTSHAVKWGKTKQNIVTEVPITVLPPFLITLDKTARFDTDMDIICHLIDVLQKCSDNDRVAIGCDIGKWLEKYGSGLTHKKSYPLTLKHKYSHGKALRYVIIPCIEEAYPLQSEIIL
jgi:hypothetical protein